MDTEKDALKWYEKPGWIIGVAVGIPILLVVFTVLAKLAGFEIKCSDTILTLVGILATFVVIGNYLQTQSIQKGVDNKLLQHNKEMREKETEYKEELKREIRQIYEHQRNTDAETSALANALNNFHSNNADKDIDVTPFKNIYSQINDLKKQNEENNKS